MHREDVPDGGWYVGPDDRARVAARPPAGAEEIFGPVLTVVPADDLDDAVALANDTDYALTAGVLLPLAGHHRRGRPGAAGRQRLRQPPHRGGRRRPPAVRRLRPVGRRLEGGRPRLPAPVRRSPRRHREHRAPGLRGLATPVTSVSPWTASSSPRSTSAACAAPVDSPLVAEFMDALDPINAAGRGHRWFRVALPDRGGQRHRGAPVRRRQHPGEHVGLGVRRPPRRVRLPLGPRRVPAAPAGVVRADDARRSPRCGGYRPVTSPRSRRASSGWSTCGPTGRRPTPSPSASRFPAPAASDVAR